MEELKKVPIKNGITRRFWRGPELKWDYVSCDYNGKFDIYENGDIFSHESNRFLKPSVRGIYGAVVVFLYDKDKGFGFFWMVSRLVAIHFIGDPPTPQHEADHIDGNPTNNHYTNLQWLTHSENMLRVRGQKRRKYNWNTIDGHKPPASLETRLKMADAKYKQVRVYTDNASKDYPSVEALLNDLDWYRKKFNRIMNKGGTYQNMRFEFL